MWSAVQDINEDPIESHIIGRTDMSLVVSALSQSIFSLNRRPRGSSNSRVVRSTVGANGLEPSSLSSRQGARM